MNQIIKEIIELLEKLNEKLETKEISETHKKLWSCATNFNPKTLRHGLYRIYWKSGGSSIASIGSLSDGTRWYAPTNWITVPSTDWKIVRRIEKFQIEQNE